MNRIRPMTTAFLASPRATLFVVAAGVVLTAPSIFSGLNVDDRFQRAIVAGEVPIVRSALDQYHFIADDPSERAVLLDRGFFPWFTAPEASAAFFRPLSSLGVAFDYGVLPHWPWLFHLESLALYALLILLVAALYRELLPSAPLAVLAALMFAVDEAHGMPVGWLANRNAILAAVFGVAALVSLHRDARARPGPWRIAGPVAFAFSLLSGELAVAAFGYIVAYVATMDPAPLRRRAVRLAPYAAVFVAWAIARGALGYGVRGSGYYLDPVASPGRFLAEFPGRALALAVGQVFLPGADAWGFGPPTVRLAIDVWAVAVLAIFAWVVSPVVRREASARFFVAGALLSLVPSAAVLPSERNSILTSLGVFGLVAFVVGRAIPASTLATWSRRALVGAHLVLAPLVLPLTSVMALLPDMLTRKSLDALALGPDIAKQTLVIVNSPNPLVPAFFVATPRQTGTPVPARIRTLATAESGVRIRREDERTVLVTRSPEHKWAFMDELFRDPSSPLREGERIELPGTTGVDLILSMSGPDRAASWGLALA